MNCKSKQGRKLFNENDDTNNVSMSVSDFKQTKTIDNFWLKINESDGAYDNKLILHQSMEGQIEFK